MLSSRFILSCMRERAPPSFYFIFGIIKITTGPTWNLGIYSNLQVSFKGKGKTNNNFGYIFPPCRKENIQKSQRFLYMRSA